MSAESVAASPEKSDLFPPGIPFIVGNEGAERFSYYGMRAVLYMYLTALLVRFVDEGLVAPAEMAAARAHGTEVVHLFFAGVYLFPLIGAVLSDRLLGKYNVIFWVSLIYCAGHGCGGTSRRRRVSAGWPWSVRQWVTIGRSWLESSYPWGWVSFSSTSGRGRPRTTAFWR
jgi:dipeptide/tripeptide permease